MKEKDMEAPSQLKLKILAKTFIFVFLLVFFLFLKLDPQSKFSNISPEFKIHQKMLDIFEWTLSCRFFDNYVSCLDM